jgi:hypothetical protein
LSIPSPRRESFELRFRRPNRLFESSRVGNMEVTILNELPLSVGAGPRDGMSSIHGTSPLESGTRD